MTASLAAAPLMPARQALAAAEAQALAPLLAALGCRMLGLFLLLPVLAPYVLDLPAGTPQLAGLALGAYGLTQACMIAPLGWLSDRWGRKPVLCAGLLVFAAGGLLAASLEHPVAAILGRALQGMGAISAVVLAGISDLTPPAKRAQGMALAGVAIGGAFALAMVAATPLAELLGVRGLFAATAALALLAIPAVLACPLPRPAAPEAGSWQVDRRMLPFCLGVFGIHWAMAALFLHLPLLLAATSGGLPAWLLYLLGFVLSVAVALPLLIRRSQDDWTLRLATALLVAGLVMAQFAPGTALTVLALAAFFAGFNLLEAIMPARVSLLAGPAGRGAAMGAYAISQALGVFAGAAVAGRLAEHGALGIYLSCAVAAAWLLTLRFSR